MHVENDFSKRLEQASLLHASGQFEPALRLYSQLLSQQPSNPGIWSRLAVLMSQMGSMGPALKSYARSLCLDPLQPQTRCNLAKAYLAMGETKRSEHALIEALCLDPADFLVLWNLTLFALDIRKDRHGITLIKRIQELAPQQIEPRLRFCEFLMAEGHFAEAIEQLKYAQQWDPLNPAIAFTLGNGFFSIAEPEHACRAYRAALCLEPRLADAMGNLGLSLDQSGQRIPAMGILQRALVLAPGSPNILNNLGSIAFELADLETAHGAFSAAIGSQPTFANAWLNRARTRYQRQEIEAAIEDARATLALLPDCAPALEIAGLGSNGLRRWQDAIRFFKWAIATAPRDAMLRTRFGSALDQMRFNEEAVRVLRSSLCLEPALPEGMMGLSAILWRLKEYVDSIQLQSRVLALGFELPFYEGEQIHRRMHLADWQRFDDSLGALNAHVRAGKPSVDPFAYLAMVDDPALHLCCAAAYVDYLRPATAPYPQRPQAPARKLRLGYFSSDFRDHPVAHLMARLLELHDRERFEVFAFSYGGSVDDPWRDRIRAAVDDFREVTLLADPAVVEMARALEIDIAIDLNGHTLGARPGIFALRAAPIQLQYIGFLGTLGAPWVDYLIADPCVIPASEKGHYQEKIIALPLFQTNEDYQPIEALGANRSAEGLPSSAFIYCCFNNNFKLTPRVFSAWMRILRAVPDGILWLYASNPLVQAHLEHEAERHGIDPKRLVFARRLPLEEHLRRLTLADVFLDTHPYNAGATASNALRAGVPVLTYLGRSFVSRMSGSLIQAAGLEALVAEDLEDYVEKAIALGQDSEQLDRHKKALRSGLANSRLFDTKAFARHLEQAFEMIHARRLQGLPPEHLDIMPTP